jgi:glycosyltransferase involved in cell wall biosynthesis
MRFFLRRFSGQPPQAVVLSSPSIAHFALVPTLSRYFPNSVITLEIRDIWPLSAELLGANRFPPFIWWLRRCEKLGMGQAHVVIGLMPGIGEYIATHFPRFPQAQVHFIPHALDGQEHLDWDRNSHGGYRYFLGYAGTLGRANDLKTLLQALVILHDMGIDPPTLIIGDGQGSQSLRRMASRLPHVHFVGWKPRPETLDLLSQCALCYDGFLDIPLYQYGFSRLKWVDYFLLKKPVIASYSGSFLEFDMHMAGWQVPAQKPILLAQKIQGLYHPGQAGELRKKGEDAYKWLVSNRDCRTLANKFADIVTSQLKHPPI